MPKPLRIEAGLGDPPSQFTNNDNEAANLVIKNHMHFEEKEPYKFIEEIKEVVEAQFRDEERAVFGRGPYRVRQHFSIWLLMA